MIYEFPDCALPVDETQYLAISDSANTEDQRITVIDLVAPAELRRSNADDDIISGCGTDSGTGLYTPDDTTNNLRTVDFVTAGLQANLFNADKLLDAKLSQIQNSGSKFWAVTLTSSQILNLLATPVLVLPAPGAGYFNSVKRVFYKLNFVTTQYVTTANNKSFYLRYDSLTYPNSIANICNEPFIESGADLINTSNSNLNFIDVKTNEDIYIDSTFSGECTTGDSTISLLIEYETIQDFSALVTPPVQPTCLQTLTGTFVNADITALGNLVITHNLNTTDLMSMVITDNNGTQVAVTSTLGNEAGANTLNQITVPIGLGIAGTWSYAIIMNVC